LSTFFIFTRFSAAAPKFEFIIGYVFEGELSGSSFSGTLSNSLERPRLNIYFFLFLNPGILGMVFFFLCLDPNLSGDPLLDGTPLLVEMFSERNEFPSELSGLNSDPSL